MTNQNVEILLGKVIIRDKFAYRAGNMEEYVRVSDISNYLKCPRKVYYTYQGERPARNISQEYVASLLIREMGRSFEDVVVSEDMGHTLQTLLDISTQQITTIYREELQDMEPETLSAAVETVREGLGEIESGLVQSIERFGTDRLVEMISSVETEPVYYSGKFSISGSPDRLLMLGDDTISLSIIKTGKAPQTGIWKDDRLRLTALAILVEEEYDCMVGSGVVEYARYGVVREVNIRRSDRRKVLVLAGRVKKIKGGRLPERPESAPCDYCGYSGFCQVTPTLASKFF